MPRFALLSAAVTAASKLWGRHTPPLAACVGQPNGGRHPTSQTALPRPSPLQLGRYFEVEERQSGLFQELRAGIVCFLVGGSCVPAPPPLVLTLGHAGPCLQLRCAIASTRIVPP